MNQSLHRPTLLLFVVVLHLLYLIPLLLLLGASFSTGASAEIFKPSSGGSYNNKKNNPNKLFGIIVNKNNNNNDNILTSTTTKNEENNDKVIIMSTAAVDKLKPVVVCGPSGVGKGTLIEMLMKHFPNKQLGFSVSHTTRGPREGEVDGVHYNFTTVEQIQKDIKDGKFIEYANVHGKYYGTSIAAVETVQSLGQVCILDIDIQGAQSVKKSNIDAHYIFIAPPSMEELEKRLRGRGTETEDAIQTRLGNAQKELDYGNEDGNFDKIFINNDLQSTFNEIAKQFQDWYPNLKPVA